MQKPEFPQEFVLKHCPKVLEARHWRGVYKSGGQDLDDLFYAECAFKPAGLGLECESCKCFLCPTQPITEKDKFLEPIRQFYRESQEYEKKEEQIGKKEVHLLVHGEHSDFSIDGVFSTYNKAEKIKKEMEQISDEDYDIWSYALNHLDGLVSKACYHCVVNIQSGDITICEETKDLVLEHKKGEAHLRNHEEVLATSYISQKHAEKLAVELRQKFLREKIDHLIED